MMPLVVPLVAPLVGPLAVALVVVSVTTLMMPLVVTLVVVSVTTLVVTLMMPLVVSLVVSLVVPLMMPLVVAPVVQLTVALVVALVVAPVVALVMLANTMHLLVFDLLVHLAHFTHPLHATVTLLLSAFNGLLDHKTMSLSHLGTMLRCMRMKPKLVVEMAEALVCATPTLQVCRVCFHLAIFMLHG